MGLYQRLHDIWYGRAPGAALLAPLAWLYGLVAVARRALYRSGWLRAARAGAPVVVIGNVTAGGTGKTPLVIWLVRTLTSRGLRAGVVSRGYGGRPPHGPHLVTSEDRPDRVGDEPCMISRRTGVPVVVARRRAAGARRLVDLGVDVVICDDGLQHYALARDMEIVVVDGERGLGNGRLIPAGPLREPATRLDDVDCVVVNGGDPGAGDIGMQLAGAELRNLGSGQRRPIAQVRGETWHAIAGIGHPERFFRSLERHGLQILRHPHPDHARLAPQDVSFDDDYPVLMTEKDAVKCESFVSSRLWYLPVEAEFRDGDDERLLGVLARSCGLNL